MSRTTYDDETKDNFHLKAFALLIGGFCLFCTGFFAPYIDAELYGDFTSGQVCGVFGTVGAIMFWNGVKRWAISFGNENVVNYKEEGP